MLKLDRAFPRLMLAGGFLFVAATAAQAAGALAGPMASVGVCLLHTAAVHGAAGDQTRE